MQNQIEIVRYDSSLKSTWNEFVESSKNGTFLFNRDYMDYHSDRFKDNSLLFYNKQKLYCILPANLHDNVLYSHQGLTYGGLIMNSKCTAEGILHVFQSLFFYCKESGINKIIYKPVPHIYHSIPSEEDLYALFRYNASLAVRNVSSTISQKEKINFSNLRKRMIKKGINNNLIIEESRDIKEFWEILTQNLKQKYNVLPVHSFDEIKLLQDLFPENIKLFTAKKTNELLGGVLIYITKNVAHAQYISATAKGKETGALDCIFEYLINKYQHLSYFDFGISCEDRGRYLNESLIFQKESFGARAICYDTYEISL